MIPDFQLTEGERASSLWLRLQGHMVERLEYARKENDKPLDIAATATVRGQIATLKQLIALGEDKPFMDMIG